MSKYTFICEHDEFGSNSTHTTEFRADTLNEILENFELFLRGAGFVTEGQLDFVRDDYDSVQIEPAPEPNKDDAFEQVIKDHLAYLDSRRTQNQNCSVCGLNMNVMMGQRCYDPKCPKTADYAY